MKSWSFEETNKIDQPLARQSNKEREKTQMTKLRYVRRDITTYSTERKRIIREYYEQLDVNILDNVNEKDKFLKTHNLSRISHE